MITVDCRLNWIPYDHLTPLGLKDQRCMCIWVTCQIVCLGLVSKVSCMPKVTTIPRPRLKQLESLFSLPIFLTSFHSHTTFYIFQHTLLYFYLLIHHQIKLLYLGYFFVTNFKDVFIWLEWIIVLCSCGVQYLDSFYFILLIDGVYLHLGTVCSNAYQ